VIEGHRTCRPICPLLFARRIKDLGGQLLDFKIQAVNMREMNIEGYVTIGKAQHTSV